MNRVALIIGNEAYPDSPLTNPVNDAQAVGDKLDRLGFGTLIHTDATHIEMEKGLKLFSSKLDSCDVALFFFAGHGMQIEGKNYLTAVDTDFEGEIDAKHSSLPLDKVIETMEKGSNPTDIIMLDACRTNPYERRWRGTESRGLAPVYAPKGMIIGYATSPGQVAYDGDGKNGAYTDAFLKHVSTPDTTIEDLFKRVRNTLSLSTQGRQISWEHTSLMGDFYFNYSFVSDELVAEYSDSALADSDYQSFSSDMAREILEGLRSLNWHKQNPAISKITSDNLEHFSKDDLFVLGRNIYQAACGNTHGALSYLKNLQTRLGELGGNISYHILNGMLFEMYFNSKGRFRDEPKSIKMDYVFLLEESDKFHESFKFIGQALRPYFKNIFYVPSYARSVSVDVICIDFENGLKAVYEVFYEGENVLYNDSGDNYYDPFDDQSMLKWSVLEIKEHVSMAMVVPTYRLKLNFLNLDDEADELLAPIRMNIRRLSK